MNISLSPRLQCIANFVRINDIVIDVGTDHAYVPIWLLQNGVSKKVYATDIHRGPLNNALRDAEKYGVFSNLELILGNGLTCCSQDIADTIIIAGMGGENIIEILEAAPWVIQKRLILQPQTKIPELREWLRTHGFSILDASLAYDAGKIYLIWLVESEEMPAYSTDERILFEKREPLLRYYIEERIKQLKKQIHGMEKSIYVDGTQIDMLKRELNEYTATYTEVLKWQQ